METEKRSVKANEQPNEEIVSRRKTKDLNYEKMKKYIDTSDALRSKARLSFYCLDSQTISDRKLKGTLRRSEKKQHEQAYALAQSEWLNTEEPGYVSADGMEKTYALTQTQLRPLLDHAAQQKQFEIQGLGPYTLDYSINGRHMLIGGRKVTQPPGHIGAFDWKSSKLSCEVQLAETVRDVKWLHNETMFAVAQKKYVHIYDSVGIELHCLTKHLEVNKLAFLPFHWLLASIGYLRYQDTSTGKAVAEIRTGLGRCDVMQQNPHNAIIHLGHSNGHVTLYTPNMQKPVVKMWCHRGPVKGLAVDQAGNYMVTTGLDGQMKIWDVRTYKPVDAYFTPAPVSSIDISQTGLIAISYGPNISIWKDAFKTKAQSPYMTHLHPSTSIQDVHFSPYEDVLGYGHTGGVSSIIIPGAGSAHYNQVGTNPNETKKQRRDGEVYALLEKIQPGMITLDPTTLGKVVSSAQEFVDQSGAAEFEANTGEAFIPKFKKRGKSASQRKFLRKQQNVVDEKREMIKESLAKEDKEKEIAEKRAAGGYKEQEFSALDRFAKKAKY